MPYGAHAKTRHGVKLHKLGLYSGLLLGVLLASSPLTAYAEDKIVEVTVCQATSQASLSITAPAQNTKVVSVPVAISGSVDMVSQIRVYVDDAYSETIPIDAGASTFTYNYTSPVGRHTILLEGVAVCGTNPSQSLTLTYVPPQLPPVVGSVPPATNTSNAMVSGEPITPDDSSQQIVIGGIDVGGIVSDITYDSLVALDFATPESLATVPAMATRFALVTVGLTAVVFAVPLVQAAATVLPPRMFGLRGAINNGAAVNPHTHRIVRIVGAIMFIVPIIWNS